MFAVREFRTYCLQKYKKLNTKLLTMNFFQNKKPIFAFQIQSPFYNEPKH